MANGFQGFQGFGSPQPDLGTSEGLLQLAQSQGGAVSQVATELVHPKTSILSTVSNGFKNAFSDFIDIISVPNQVIAGAISSKYTVKEAIEKNISTSDVVYGKSDPNASMYQKVGGFAVRLATDVLLDPLTYLTFGTGTLLSSGAKSSVVLGESAARAFGKEAFETAALSKEGQKALTYLAKLKKQSDGTSKLADLKAGSKIFDMGENELKQVLSQTIDSKLDDGFANQVMSKILEKNPALVNDFLDKGGIKYFGQTIVSAQRMKATMEMIPGMTSLDVITEQPRRAFMSLFSDNYQKLNSGKWVRVPKGITEMAQKSKDILLARQDRKMLELADVVKAFDLGDTEGKFLMAAVENKMIPSSPKLQAAYKHMLGYADDDWKKLVDDGFLSTETKLESFAPHILVETPPSSVSFSMPPSAKTGATKERKLAKFVNQKTGQVQVGHTKELGLERVMTAAEEEKIITAMNAVYDKTASNIAKANKEIEQLAAVVNDVFSGKVSAATKGILKNAKGLDKQNLKLFVQAAVNEAGDISVDKLAKAYAKKNYSQGVKKSVQQAVNDLSPEALEALTKRVAKAAGALPDDMAHLNEALSEAIKKAPKKKSTGAATNTAGEIKDMMAKVKNASEAERAAMLREGVDKESMAKFVEGIRHAFIEDPQGARKAIEAIIGKKQLVTDMLHELDLATTASKMDILGLPSKPVVYKNAAGDFFTKETAPIFNVRDAQFFQEIEETLLRDPKAAAKMLGDIKQDGFEIFDDNLVTAWAARSLKNSKAVTMKDFLHDVASNFGVEAEFASPGFVKISSEGLNKEATTILSTMGKESEMMYHPAVASYIEKFATSVVGDDATMDFLKSYDKLQNFWKASVTSVWPAFHGRNALSNVLQNYLDIGLSAMDPRTHVMSTQLIHAQRAMAKLQKEAIGGSAQAQSKIAEISTKKFFTDVTGHTWTYGEIVQVAKNHNIAFTSRIVSSSDAAGGPEAIAEALFAAKTVKGKVGRALATPGRIGQDVVGRTVEEQGRLVNFITHLKETGDVTMASRQTKQFLFDYGNLTSFERNVMRRIIPFYTFTRKNLELQARALITTPGKIAAEVHGFETLGEVISGGEQLTDEEREQLPDWVKSGMTILTKKNGSQVNILRNFGTPLEAPFQQMQANQLLGSVSPLLRVPVELGASYNFFSGKPLSEVTNAAAFVHAPKFLKDAIGFTTIEQADGSKWNVAMRPEMMHLLLNLPPTPRVYSTLAGLENKSTTDQEKIISNLIGVKLSSFDLQEEQAKKERELRRQLEDLLTQAHVTAKYTRTFIPKTAEEKEAANSFKGF